MQRYMPHEDNFFFFRDRDSRSMVAISESDSDSAAIAGAGNTGIHRTVAVEHSRRASVRGGGYMRKDEVLFVVVKL